MKRTSSGCKNRKTKTRRCWRDGVNDGKDARGQREVKWQTSGVGGVTFRGTRISLSSRTWAEPVSPPLADWTTGDGEGKQKDAATDALALSFCLSHSLSLFPQFLSSACQERRGLLPPSSSSSSSSTASPSSSSFSSGLCLVSFVLSFRG